MGTVMEIPDLTVFPVHRPPFRHGIVGNQTLPADHILYAVGWLGSTVPCSGETPDECISRLFEAYQKQLFFPDTTMGWHNCEICSGKEHWYPDGKVGPVVHWRGETLRLYGHGHYLVRLDKNVFMAPKLLLHYIVDHCYRPPSEFVEAVTEGEFLRAHDLVVGRSRRRA